MDLLLLLASCAPAGEAPTSTASDPPSTATTGGTAASTTPGAATTGPVDWLDPPAGCIDPPTLGPDPIAQLGLWHHEESDWGFPIEHTDVTWDAERERMLAAGQGGLAVYAVDEAGVPELLALHPGDTDARWYQVELMGTVVALSNRDRDEVAFVDVTDPSAPTGIATLEVELATGMAWAPPYLYVLGLDGALTVVDAADPARPEVAARLEDILDTPWEIAVEGDRAWVADNSLGIVPLDLADPLRARAEEPVPTGGSALDLAVEEGLLAVAAGAVGLQLYDLADPAVPALLGSWAYGASVQAVALDDGLAWGADREEVVLVDATDGASLGVEPTERFAMGIDAAGGRAYVADWSDAVVFEADRQVRAPYGLLEAEEIYVDPATGTARVELANVGASELSILGGEVDDGRLRLQLDRLAVAPGEAAELRLSWDPAAVASIDATLCLSTDTPGNPFPSARVQSTSTTGSALVVGEEAPLFTLDDLDGEPWTLSDHLGTPVVLVFFSTWCPGCVEEMLDLEATTGPALEALGAVLVAIGPDDTLENLETFRDAFSITFPILWDADGRVHQEYENIDAFPTASYPEEWVVGSDGRIAYVNNHYEPDELLRAVEAELEGG